MKKFFLIITLTAAALLTACQVPPENTISIGPRTISAPARGGEFTGKVSCNGSWVVQYKDTIPGFTIEPSTGYGDATWILTVPPNLGEARNVKFHFSASGTTVLDIKQEGAKPMITVNPMLSSVECEGGEIKYNIKANYNWSVTSDRELTITPSSGEAGEFEVVATVPENTEDEIISYNLSFLCLDSTVMATIEQTPKAAAIEVTPDTASVPAEGGSVTATIVSNYSWAAACDMAGVTISPSSGDKGTTEITITVSKNESPTLVEFPIQFECSNGNDSASDVLVISQTPVSATISASPSEGEVPAAGGTVAVSIISNYPWLYIAKDNGITVTPATGEAGTTEVSISIPESVGNQILTHIVSFICSNGEINDTSDVTITQRLAPPTISVNPNTLEFAWDEKTKDVTVSCNRADWNTTADEGVTFSYSGNTLSVTIPNNVTTENKTYNLYLEVVDGSETASETLTIVQTPATILSYGGVDYPVKWLADGRLWMCENLRYIPEGVTPSSDPSEEAGMWYPNALSSTAKTDAESIAKYGYLYNTSTACAIPEINADNFKSFEGCQGICPDGWHIPSEAECNALINAYWNEDQKGALFAELAEAGFSSDLGGFRQKNTSSNNGTYSAAMHGYIMSSTGKSYAVNVDTGAINSKNRALMKTNTSKFQRYTVADLSNFGGCSVRCIRNAE